MLQATVHDSRFAPIPACKPTYQKRAIRRVHISMNGEPFDLGWYSVRGWDGRERNYFEDDLLSGPMSMESNTCMNGLIRAADRSAGQWVDYPNG